MMNGTLQRHAHGVVRAAMPSGVCISGGNYFDVLLAFQAPSSCLQNQNCHASDVVLWLMFAASNLHVCADFVCVVDNGLKVMVISGSLRLGVLCHVDSALSALWFNTSPIFSLNAGRSLAGIWEAIVPFKNDNCPATAGAQMTAALRTTESRARDFMYLFSLLGMIIEWRRITLHCYGATPG